MKTACPPKSHPAFPSPTRSEQQGDSGNAKVSDEKVKDLRPIIPPGAMGKGKVKVHPATDDDGGLDEGAL